MSESTSELLELIRRELDLDDSDDLSIASTADTVENWDSLGHLRLCMAIESRYGIRIPLERVGELTTVEALHALLESA